MPVPIAEAIAWLILPATWWPLLLFVGGTVIVAYINGQTKYRYDSQLENLRAELNSQAEAQRNRDRSQQDQLSDLRATSLSSMSGRHAALEERRLLAAERLWATVVAHAPAKAAMRMTAAMNMDAVFKRVEQGGEQGRKMQEFADALWKTAGLDDMMNVKGLDGLLERPFISPVAWATFSALRLAVTIPIAQLGVLRAGAGREALQEDKSMLEPLKAAMPHLAEFIDKYGMRGVSAVVMEQLEDKLLAELRESLEGREADARSVERAAAVVQAVAAANERLASIGIPEELKETAPDVRP